MLYPQLYKRTSTGKVQVWFAEVDGSRYRTTSGQLDGKKSTAAWTQCEAKNVGRANEVTPENQAIAEVEALYTKQRRKDYHDDLANVDKQMRVNPMLAKKWADEVDRIPDDVSIGYEPKLDGFRCVTTKDGMFTRDGLPIVTAPHIFEELAYLFKIDPTHEFDGELYTHEYHNDFNKISSMLKKQKPTSAHLEESRQKVQYWIYDMPSHSGTRQERRNTLVEMFLEMDPAVQLKSVVLTPSFNGTKEEAAAYFAAFKGQNYEGAMGKRNDGLYENKRSKNLLKIKEFLDEEFQIVDIESGRGSRAEIAARAIMQLKDGRTFEVGIIGDWDYCGNLLENKANFIGSPGTVQFLNYTPAGIPRGGKLKTVRTFS